MLLSWPLDAMAKLRFGAEPDLSPIQIQMWDPGKDMAWTKQGGIPIISLSSSAKKNNNCNKVQVLKLEVFYK